MLFLFDCILSYFQIKNPTKIKKWTKKARQTLAKMPVDLFYEKYANNK